jgi:hypothetical protein
VSHWGLILLLCRYSYRTYVVFYLFFLVVCYIFFSNSAGLISVFACTIAEYNLHYVQLEEIICPLSIISISDDGN